MTTLQNTHRHPANPRRPVTTALFALLVAVAIGVSILFLIITSARPATNPPPPSTGVQLRGAPSARAECDAANLGAQLRVAKPCYALP